LLKYILPSPLSSNIIGAFACNKSKYSSSESPSLLFKILSYFLPLYNLNLVCDGVNTANNPGIFYLIPALVKNTDIVDINLVNTSLLLQGKTPFKSS
jgi:hypothetical protein